MKFNELSKLIEKQSKASSCGRCGQVHIKGTKCKIPYLKGKDHNYQDTTLPTTPISL